MAPYPCGTGNFGLKGSCSIQKERKGTSLLTSLLSSCLSVFPEKVILQTSTALPAE